MKVVTDGIIVMVSNVGLLLSNDVWKRSSALGVCGDMEMGCGDVVMD